MFISSLVEARSSLYSDYSNADESTKTNNYTKISSNLYTAANILDVSSYNNKNRNQLFGGIYNLYLCMTKPDTRSDIVTNKEAIVRECLTKIIQDTNDKEASEALDKLTGDIYFKH